jgi:hypothetical protein
MPIRSAQGLDQLGPVQHGYGPGHLSKKPLRGKIIAQSLAARQATSLSGRRRMITLPRLKFMEDDTR